MRAYVGDDKMWKPLPGFFTPGTHNFEMMARMLLNGDFMFCAAFDFNELRVAKTAHSTTLAQ
jgi:hypothetical protein